MTTRPLDLYKDAPFDHRDRVDPYADLYNVAPFDHRAAANLYKLL